MSFVALDIASSTGWAQWSPGWAKPIFGTWTLTGEPREVGRKCIQLHRKLADLHSLCPIERLVFEGGIPPSALTGFSNMTTIYLLAALAAHAESFAEAVGARCRNLPNTSWKKHFLGRGVRKGTGLSVADFKKLSISQCNEMGWYPDSNDAADALGILVTAVHLAGLPAPWVNDGVFTRRQFG